MNSTTNETLPQGYKMTELGPLPEEWEVVKLGEVADVNYGKANTKEIGNIPVVGSGGIYTSTKTPLVNYPTIVIGRKGTAGKAWLFLKPCYPSDTTFYLSWEKEIDVNFIYNYMVLNPLSGEHAKTTLPSLQKSDLLNFALPLPPLAEQQKIAAVLSAVQEAKEKTQVVIDAIKALKKSMMKHLFTYGPVPPEETENVPLKETEIGKVPEDWEVVKLGDLSTKKLIKVQFGFPCGKWNDKGIGIAQVRPFNINENGNIDLTVLKYIETDNDIGNYLLQKEDIIFNNTNSEELVGKTAFWKDGKIKYVLSNHMTIIRIVDKSKLNAYFLAKYLHKRWNDGFYKTICRRHVNQSSISLARLNDIALPLPPLPVQQSIASILSAIDAKIEAEEKKKQAIEELFKTLLHNLMTAKIRVNNLEIKV
jgi:type I restriction enzyme S subunit